MKEKQKARSPLPRKNITRIEVYLENEGKPLVIEGDQLHDPLGGILAWNDFAIHQLVAPFYDRTHAHGLTGLDVIRWWHGRSSALGNERSSAPSFLIRPTCEPACPPHE